MRITLKDIAVKARVTKASVSMALRNSPRISPERREEIQRIAAELGYVPDPFLAGLAKYRAAKDAPHAQGVIAWLNHWDQPQQLRGYGEFDQYWRGARQLSKRLGYRLDEFVWPAGGPAKLVEQTLLKRGVLGLLIPPHPPEADWGDFDWSKFSLMRFGLSVRYPDSNLVTSDHQRTVVMAVRKIHEYGYRRIGLVMSEASDRSWGGNYSGGFAWAQKLLELDPALPPMNKNPQPSPKGIAGYKSALDRWMRKYQPDAILNYSAEVPAYLRELGYRIPQDVAVAGTSICDIPVDAGINQHSYAIGRIAAEMLIKQISLNERGEPSAPCRILVESRWQDGKTLPRRRQLKPG
jgi:DNA-binding LacI/PurR family transcriptional regulator